MPFEPIPFHLLQGLRRWIDDGIEPGSFLQHVLRSDLQSALRYADPHSLRSLGYILAWLDENAPRECYGSKAAYEAWRRKHRERLTAKHTTTENT